MKQGILVFDCISGRYDFEYGIEQYYGGFHCGECLEIYYQGEWKQTRIEYANDEWYLIGFFDLSLSGLLVRVD